MGSDIQYLCDWVVASTDQNGRKHRLAWLKPILRHTLLSFPCTTKEAPELLGEQAVDCEISEAVHARLRYFYFYIDRVKDSSFRMEFADFV
jgi:hypothetical protein